MMSFGTPPRVRPSGEPIGVARGVPPPQPLPRDITPWLHWFLDCLERAFDGAGAILANVLRKARFWEAHADASFTGRQRLVLNRLLDGFEGKLTSSKWAKLTKVSQATAARDIEDLVQRHALQKDAAGGRSTSYSLRE
jgi:Fic family protein